MVLSWFASKLSPIAVDIGTESIKLLQVEPPPRGEGQHRLVAAATETIPDEVRGRSADREAFVSDTLRRLLSEGFRGRQVVTCLPAAVMAIQHLRVGRMTPDELAKALPFEVAGKIPFDPHRAVLRHTIAGEVYHNQESKLEVILMAAPRDAVDRHLNLLSRQKLEVVGIHIEQHALVECFNHLFRRKGDENVSTMFIDIGAGATHVVIAHGKNLVFAKHVGIGGEAFNKALADHLKISLIQARELRIRSSHQNGAARLPAGVVGIGTDARSHPLGRQNAAAPAGGDAEDSAGVDEALEGAITTLISELQLCMRYYEGTFPGRAVDRAIFVGGEARHIAMCQRIARQLGMPATLGDPLARLMKDAATHTRVDTRQPQPGWAIAVGLALGLSPLPEREA